MQDIFKNRNTVAVLKTPTPTLVVHPPSPRMPQTRIDSRFLVDYPVLQPIWPQEGWEEGDHLSPWFPHFSTKQATKAL